MTTNHHAAHDRLIDPLGPLDRQPKFGQRSRHALRERQDFKELLAELKTQQKKQ